MSCLCTEYQRGERNEKKFTQKKIMSMLVGSGYLNSCKNRGVVAIDFISIRRTYSHNTHPEKLPVLERAVLSNL